MPQFNARDVQYQRAAVAMVTSASMVYRPEERECLQILSLANRIPKLTKEEILELAETDEMFRMLILNNQIQHQVNRLVKVAEKANS